MAGDRHEPFGYGDAEVQPLKQRHPLSVRQLILRLVQQPASFDEAFDAFPHPHATCAAETVDLLRPGLASRGGSTSPVRACLDGAAGLEVASSLLRRSSWPARTPLRRAFAFVVAMTHQASTA